MSADHDEMPKTFDELVAEGHEAADVAAELLFSGRLRWPAPRDDDPVGR